MLGQIQILGLRKFFDEKEQKDKVYDAFFEKGWCAPGVANLFLNVENLLKLIPAHEQWNLYYTAALCTDKKRELLRQEIIPFDIDGIDLTKDLAVYTDAVCNALAINATQTGIVYTGNGLQFIVGLTPELHFAQTTYFRDNRDHYRALCTRVDAALKEAGLPGNADPTVFSAARILRLPGTLNRKPKGEKMGKLLQAVITPIAFDIRARSGLPAVAEADHIDPAVLKRYPKPDTAAVLAGCGFLKHCKEKPNEVREADWYAMLSVVGRLDKGSEHAHDLSRSHRGYSAAETDAKLTQALKSSGPRTCKDIHSRFDGCKACPHFEKITSPILIRGPGFIKTESTGFHDIIIRDNGAVSKRPNYEDLRRFFEREHPYALLGASKYCLVYNGKYWAEMANIYLENFAQIHFEPTAVTTMTQEFANLVTRTNLRDPNWFVESTNRLVNFNNGVLDLDKLELRPHSPTYGFRYVLPYDYDAKATAPRFQQFLAEITEENAELQAILMEFAGYAFSSDECWTEKCLLLTGDGANGKSTFLNILKALAGKENYSALTLTDLKEPTNRALMDGKLFNLAEETPKYAMMESSLFKNLVTGGETTAKFLYKQPYAIANKCKLIFACNELPKTADITGGYFRRLVIVPFNRAFAGEARDPFLKQKLLAELPGIFNLLVEGYRRLTKQVDFTGSEKVKSEIKKYRIESDTVEAWFRDCATDTPEATHVAVMSEMYASYDVFCEKRGEKAEAYVMFAKRLAKLVPGYNTRHSRRIMNRQKESVITGLSYASQTDF